MPPETDKKTENESAQPGNPTSVAMRVNDIVAVVQPRGKAEFNVAAIDGSLETENSLGDAEYDLNGETLEVQLAFSFRGFIGNPDQVHNDEEPERTANIAIDGTFIVLYSLEAGDDLSEADLKAFSHINGPLNVVPYWREFVSSSFVRAGLPAYTVPVFNPAKMAKVLAEERTAALPEAKSSGDDDT